jgi:hypothetical protein
MRPISKLLLSAGALAACLAPALQAELSGAQLQPFLDTQASDSVPGSTLTQFLPAGSGTGCGIWIAPTESAGFASAQLYDVAGRLRYTMRANLLPAQSNLPGLDVQGGFLGVLFLVDRIGNKTKVADISGKWVRHADGFGEFGVEMVVHTGNRDQPQVSAGVIEGALLPPGIMPGPGYVPVEGDQDESGPAVGQLALQWVIPEA